MLQPTALPNIRSIAWIVALIHAAGLFLVLAWWGERGLPFSMGRANETGQSMALSNQANKEDRAKALLPCVSYSPFRHPGINPFNPQARVSPAQIESDLRILLTRTRCVRTYGLTQGLEAVPGIAARLGMRVKLGVWLARDATENQKQIDLGVALARQFPGVIDLLVVGNEVLLRREMTPEALGNVLDYARERSPVPVTYADVWEFWLRNSQLAARVDLVTVHILPYWEDDPVALHDAVSHVFAIAAKLKAHFTDKPVWIGETGWPAAGRQRAGAVPGRVEQIRFVSELAQRSQSMHLGAAVLDFNLIEAFDQPWKRSFEGAMGGYWGLFDALGQPRGTNANEIVEDTNWWRGWVGALAGGLIVAVAATRFRQVSALRTWPAVFAGATLGALVPVQWLMVQQWDRTLGEQGLSAILAALSALTTGIFVLGGTSSGSVWKRFALTMRTLVLFAAATAALVLLLDPRYRPFPWWWFLAPAVTWLACCVRAVAAPMACFGDPTRQQNLLAAVVAGCAVGIVLAEGWRNTQALQYGAVLLLLAGASSFGSRVSASKASKAAGAHNSVV